MGNLPKKELAAADNEGVLLQIREDDPDNGTLLEELFQTVYESTASQTHRLEALLKALGNRGNEP